MTTPVVLITGALTGIGRATALATTQAGLIEKGTLRMVMRTINKSDSFWIGKSKQKKEMNKSKVFSF